MTDAEDDDEADDQKHSSRSERAQPGAHDVRVEVGAGRAHDLGVGFVARQRLAIRMMGR